MITRTKAFLTSDGETFSDVQSAQAHEIELLLVDFKPVDGESESTAIARFILENKDKIVDILTTKDGSKPKARAVNGGTKTRKPKATQNAPADPKQQTMV